MSTTWKILIIDDDEEDFFIAKEMLKKAKGRKYEVHWAASYEAGREAYLSDHYHAVLVDHDLGSHSGVELIREANEQGYSTPHILFTSHESYEIDVEAMQAGATLYLTKKEANPMLLERAIRYAIERKQIETSLRHTAGELVEANRKLAYQASLLDNISEAVITTDARYHILSWNRAAETMYGWQAEEVLGKPPMMFLQTEYLDDTSPADAVGQLQEQGCWKGEVRQHRKDGTFIYVAASVTSLKDSAGMTTGVIAINRDVTERKQAEQAILESEARQKLALDAARMVAWEYDPATLKVTLSENAEKVLDLQQRHENSDQGYNLIHPDDVEHHRALVTKAIETGGSYMSVYRLAHSEQVVWFEEHGRAVIDQAGKTIRLVGVLQNINARKATEEALRRSEEKFARAFRSSPVAVSISTIDDGRLIEVNDSYTNLFGFSREELIGHTTIELGLYPDSRVRQELVRQFRASGGGGRDYELQLRTKSGDYRDVLISTEPMEIDGQDCILSLTVDITERKRTEAALQESEQKYRSLFESSVDAVFLTTPDGAIEAANPAACAMLGRSEQEICSIGRSGVLDYGDPRLAAALEERKRAGRIQRRELTAIRKSGERFPVEVDSVILPSEPVRSFVIIRDITERKRAEEALRANSEALQEREGVLRLALTAGKAGVWSWDLTTNTMQWSDEFYRIFGYEPNSVTPSVKAGMNHVHSEDRPQIEAEQQEAIEQGKQIDTIHRVLWPDGSVHWVRGMSHAFYTSDGKPYRMAGIAIDVTQEKMTEAALRESEERYRLAASATNNAIWDWDLTTDVVDWNEALTEVFGYDPSDQHNRLGGLWDTQIHPDDRASVVDSMQAVIDGGSEVWTAEYRFRRADGSYAEVRDRGWVVRDEGGRAVRMVGAMDDITFQKEAERELRKQRDALRESEARLQELSNAMPQVVWTARPDGTIDYINLRINEYEGFNPTESAGWNWANAIHPDDLQQTIDTWSRAVQVGEVHQMELRSRMADGCYHWHLARAVPVKDREGNITRWIGTNTDIEEQKQTEEKLRRSNQELEQFAFVASHDMQEPLRKIVMFGNNLRKHFLITPDEAAEENLKRMQGAAARMQTMIDGLLELSRVNARGRAFVTIPLTHVVEEVVSDLDSRIQAVGGQVKIEELPTIEADEMQMRQLFQNLIGNSIKFHQPDTPPVVHVSGAITNRNQSPMVQIRVEDNGIGFEQEYTELVFQPFQRLHGKTEYEGTGLGLAICQKIVERHHGTIEVESAPGEGTTFIIHFPLNPSS